MNAEGRKAADREKIDWILSDNLRPTLWLIGQLIGYTVSESDAYLLFQDLEDTNCNLGRWSQLRLYGDTGAIDLQIAHDESGSGITFLKFDPTNPVALGVEARTRT